MFKPIVLTEVSLIRLIRRYAKHLGLSDIMGSATAQVFLQTDPGAKRWDAWLRTNCGICEMSPDQCGYFNPDPERCQGDLTPEKLQQANMILIEMGRVEKCALLRTSSR